MKTILFLSLLVLLMGNSFCTPTETESTPDQSADKPDQSAVSNDARLNFHEVQDPAAESDLQALDDPLQSEETADTSTTADAMEDVDSQGIRISLTPGKSITLTLGGGRGYAGGVTYTRWGKSSCPRGAQLVYQGYAGAGHYTQKGNGANYLCMPRNPQYLSSTTISWPSYLYGAEYESNNRIFARGGTQNYNVPCAVCHRTTKSSKIMVPGKFSCPSSWYREYYGYLMTSHYSHNSNAQYECVDYYPDVLPGTQRNSNGALLYFVDAVCSSDGLPCGRYIRQRAVTCAVCTK